MSTQIQPTPIVTGEKAKEIERLANTEFDKDKIEQGKKVLEKMFTKTNSMNKVKDAIIEDFENSMEAWRGLATTDNMFLIGRIDAYEMAIATVKYMFDKVGTGEWCTQLISQHDTFNAYSHICKECGYFYKDTRPNGHNYCPDCGINMNGDTN